MRPMPMRTELRDVGNRPDRQCEQQMKAVARSHDASASSSSPIGSRSRASRLAGLGSIKGDAMGRYLTP